MTASLFCSFIQTALFLNVLCILNDGITHEFHTHPLNPRRPLEAKVLQLGIVAVVSIETGSFLRDGVASRIPDRF